jgi:hypothetical protein
MKISRGKVGTLDSSTFTAVDGLTQALANRRLITFAEKYIAIAQDSLIVFGSAYPAWIVLFKQRQSLQAQCSGYSLRKSISAPTEGNSYE